MTSSDLYIFGELYHQMIRLSQITWDQLIRIPEISGQSLTLEVLDSLSTDRGWAKGGRTVFRRYTGSFCVVFTDVTVVNRK